LLFCHVSREQKRKNDACYDAEYLSCKYDETGVPDSYLVSRQTMSLSRFTNYEDPSGLKTFAGVYRSALVSASLFEWKSKRKGLEVA
jgi:hypothetical protein